MDWWADLGTVAALATIAAAVLAAVGLIGTAWSVRQQARSNDLNSLFQVANQLREAEARLMGCGADPDRHDAEVVNYLNLLETFATAVNAKLFGKATRNIAQDRLVNDIAILLTNDASRARIEAAMTSVSTFPELGRFSTRHRRPIRRMKEAMLATSEVPPVPR